MAGRRAVINRASRCRPSGKRPTREWPVRIYTLALAGRLSASAAYRATNWMPSFLALL
jgi:hypothetical protein